VSAPPRIALGSPRVAPTAVMIEAAWGADGPVDGGVSSPPQGASSLVFARDAAHLAGRVALLKDGAGFAILDPDGRRILRFDRDGLETGTVRLPSSGAILGFSLAGGGGFEVLRHLPSPATGFEIQRVALNGSVEASTALTYYYDRPTGIFEDGPTGGMLVEQAFGQVCSPAGDGCKPGRPDAAGVYVTTAKLDHRTVRVAFDGHLPVQGPDLPSWAVSDAEAPPVATRLVTLAADRSVANVVDLDPVAISEQGATSHAALVVLLLYDEPGSVTQAPREPELRAVLLDAYGQKRDELSLQPCLQSDSSHHLVLGLGGALFQLCAGEEGFSVLRTDLTLFPRTLP
jgi:hypothetical protein